MLWIIILHIFDVFSKYLHTILSCLEGNFYNSKKMKSKQLKKPGPMKDEVEK